ncbi:MAG: hypothetical protein R3E82_20995 [Pseudomonadales bacterium]|nr:hypothetical protein [Pseudomonadales bacterium]
MGEPSALLQTLRLGLLYFSTVFLAGFLLGVLRTLWLAPWIGERSAELVEFPVMLVVMVLAARIVVQRCPQRTSLLLIVGGIAALGVLVFDVLVGLWLRELSLREILFERDPLTGTIYYLMIGLLVLLPAGLARIRG